MQYLNRNLYDTQCNTHYSLQHAHFVFTGVGDMGGSDGRTEPVDFRELLGRGGDIDDFGRSGATAGHHHDLAGFAAGAYDGVFSIHGVAGHYYAGIVFAAAGAR